MRRESRLSRTMIGNQAPPVRAPAEAAVATQRVMVIGDAVAPAPTKQSFAKTQAFFGVLPRADDRLPPLAEQPALSASDDIAEETTACAVEAPESRAQQLWQRQTPLVAFCMAACLCVLCLYLVNLLAP